MKKVMVVLILGTALLAGCIGIFNKEKVALSDEETQDYIEEKGVNPLKVEQTPFATYILFKDGLYNVSKVKGTGNYIEISSEWEDDYVQRARISANLTGSPYLDVVINDEKFAEELSSIEVIFIDENKEDLIVEEKSTGDMGYIIFIDKNDNEDRPIGFSEVRFYDQEGNIMDYFEEVQH